MKEGSDLISIKDACELLGVKKGYLYFMTSKKKIPHYKPSGKKIYFDKSELQNWIKANKIEVE